VKAVHAGRPVPTGAEWLRQFAPADSGAPRLVCLPHAGGSASFYLPMARALSPAVRVLAVQYPGRLDRRSEPPVEDVRELARHVMGVLASDTDDTGLAFFGHSMGALVAYEATLLGEGGHGPVPDGVFVSAARAPHLVRIAPTLLGTDSALLEEVLFLGGTSPEVLRDPDLRDLVLPALRADYRALHRYTAAPGTLVGRPVVAMVGDTDPRVTADEAAAWSRHTTGPFSLKVLSGDHFYLTSRLDQVAEAIRASFPGGWT